MRRRILVLLPTPWDEPELAGEGLRERYEFLLHGRRFWHRPMLVQALRFRIRDFIRAAVERYRGARLRMLAAIQDADVIRAILDCLGLSSLAPPVAPVAPAGAPHPFLDPGPTLAHLDGTVRSTATRGRAGRGPPAPPPPASPTPP